MKYVLIGPVYPYRGGIAHYTSMLAQALAQQCSELLVVSFRRQYPRWLYPGKTDRDPSSESLQVNAEFLLDPLYPWTWWQTARRISKWKPDVVIFQWWTTFWAPAFAVISFLLRRQRVKVLFVIHNVMPHEPRIWDRWLTLFALRQSHFFLVQTSREKDRLLSLLPQARTILSPHPVYDMFVSQRIPKAEAKQILGLPAGEPVILFFGIIRPYKGLRFAVEALAELRNQGKIFYLLVAGEFWEDIETYKQMIERLELSTQITIKNRYIPNEEVGVYFSAADVFIAPYIGGTQSGAVKVALSFDIPIVISRAIASEELEKDSTHRLYWVDPLDVVSMADVIYKCLPNNINVSTAASQTPIDNEWKKLALEIIAASIL